MVTADGCEVITKFPAEELLVAGQRYWAVDGPCRPPGGRVPPQPAGDPMTVVSEEPRVEELGLYERMALIRPPRRPPSTCSWPGWSRGTHLAWRQWPSGAPPGRTTTCSPPTAATTTPSGGQPRGLPGRADEPGTGLCGPRAAPCT